MATRRSRISARPASRHNSRRWVAGVKTDSTHPSPGLFTKSSATIAKALASPEVSPKGPGSGLRMLTYFINRGGKGLTAARKRELEKAKVLLMRRVAREREKSSKEASGD